MMILVKLFVATLASLLGLLLKIFLPKVVQRKKYQKIAPTSTSSNQNTEGIQCPKWEDVNQTTDSEALGEMLEYIKSNTDLLDVDRDSEVAHFYAGRSIFITGSTGFLGKCILEKLLRSCPALKSIYLLIRPKQDKSVESRAKDLTDSPLFDRLRNSPSGQEQLNKVIAIRGDITEPLFGLCDQDIKTLAANVSIVIHSAASVKFVEPLKVAVRNNLISMDNLINLASRLNKLEALVHVSTAYSNCNRRQIDEILYEAPIDAERLIDITNWMEPKMLEKISPALIGDRPNTYTYTKAVAESLFLEGSRKLLSGVPVAMIRPTMITGIWREPIPGWVDNFNGPTGMVTAMMTGAIQATMARRDYCVDIVPVDIVTNLIICSAWDMHESGSSEPEVTKQLESRNHPLTPQLVKSSNSNNNQQQQAKIFNCASGSLNPLTYGYLAKYIKQIGFVYPCNNLMRLPDTLFLSNEALFRTFHFVNHTLVAYICDFLLKLIGKRGQFVMIHDRMIKMITTLKPFTTNQWLFNCSNVTSMYEKLTPIDRRLFNFDIRQVRWDDYLRRYYIGLKIYALKDDPDQVVEARHKLARMHVVSLFLQIMLSIPLFYCLLELHNTLM